MTNTNKYPLQFIIIQYSWNCWIFSLWIWNLRVIISLFSMLSHYSPDPSLYKQGNWSASFTGNICIMYIYSWFGRKLYRIYVKCFFFFNYLTSFKICGNSANLHLIASICRGNSFTTDELFPFDISCGSKKPSIIFFTRKALDLRLGEKGTMPSSWYGNIAVDKSLQMWWRILPITQNDLKERKKITTNWLEAIWISAN